MSDKKLLYRIIESTDLNYFAKSVYTDANNTLLYALISFRTYSAYNTFLSNVNKKGSIGKCVLSDNINIRKGEYIYSIGKFFKGFNIKSKDINTTDGVHAIILNTKSNFIQIKNEESLLDDVYNYISNNLETGILREWTPYIYNELKSCGYMYFAKGFDLTGGLVPKILVMKENLTSEVVKEIKVKGLKNKKISLDVDEVVDLTKDYDFLEIIDKFINPYLKEMKCYYNEGEDKIDPIFNTLIRREYDYDTKLYYKQQEIAQSLLNYFKDGNKSAILNGGTGVGKTYLSIKLSFAILVRCLGRTTGRILIMCQSTLLDKWKRQVFEALAPLGINPVFYSVDTHTDIDKIPKHKNELQILLATKDMAKRSWLEEYIPKHKKYRYLDECLAFIDDIVAANKIPYGTSEQKVKKIENTPLFIDCNSMRVSQLKYIVRVVSRKLNRKVFAFKKVYYDENNPKKYKYAVVSYLRKLEKLKRIISHKISSINNSNYAYHFEVPTLKSLKEIVLIIQNSILSDNPPSGIKYGITNGYVCPYCGSFIYSKKGYEFLDNFTVPENTLPKAHTESNNSASHYIKADGTSLSSIELEDIRKGTANIVEVNEYHNNCYVDNAGNDITSDNLLAIKKGNSSLRYLILVRECNHKLWGAANVKGYNNAVESGGYYKKVHGPNIDVLVIDEAHKFNGESNQSKMVTNFTKCSKYIIPMSGTISDGKASNVFYTLFRNFTKSMKDYGYGYNSITSFKKTYGRIVEIEKTSKINFNRSGTPSQSKSEKELPGISPLLYRNFLANSMVSRKIEDMGIRLPDIKFFKHEVEMDESLKFAYGALEGDITYFMAKNKKCNAAGSFVNALLSYPDLPTDRKIYYCEGQKCERFIAEPKNLFNKSRLSNKEKKLLETVNKEISEGRRVMVYAIFTNKRNVINRLRDILKSNDIKVAVLDVPTNKREAWIEEQYNSGTEVIITHPSKVEVGLDIIGYPSIYFYELPYDAKLVRQAEKRAYRPQQKKECRVYYSYYKDTLQHEAMKLVAKKKASSLQLEGVFDDNMMNSMGDIDGDGLSALAKVLAGNGKIDDTAMDKLGFSEEEETTVVYKERELTPIERTLPLSLEDLDII